MTTWTLDLPWCRPPLSLNGRYHWAQKARLTAEIRDAVTLLAKAHKIPSCQRVHVELHYRPARNWGADADNLVATLKPAIDGIVTAGVIPDDLPAFVSWDPPQIHPKDGPARLWLVVTDLTGRTAA